jgi:hypothetical protein
MYLCRRDIAWESLSKMRYETLSSRSFTDIGMHRHDVRCQLLINYPFLRCINYGPLPCKVEAKHLLKELNLLKHF